jgi:signal transduction histidine kinase
VPVSAGASAASFETPLWRALAAFRLSGLAYAVLLFLRVHDDYASALGGWAVLGAMSAWTAFTTVAYARPAWRRRPVLVADVAVAAASVLVTRLVDTEARIDAGEQTLPVVWPAAAVLACALGGGPWAGAGAATVVATAGFVERGQIARETVHNVVLLLLAGAVIGYAIALARASQVRLARALQLEAATRERERLARDIHDSVLQVLALVARRGAEAGGEAAVLGRLAGEQEVALRALVASAAAEPSTDAGTDLRALLAPYASGTVTVSAPATPVPLPTAVAREVAAAVAAALHNVDRHAGPTARAWVLVDDEGDAVTVSVRDDGAGFDPAAVPSGRLGVAQSIEGRVRDAGGTATVVSSPGRGTEVELRVPRRLPA